MLHGDSTYVCKQCYRNAIFANIFPVGVALLARAVKPVCTTMESPAGRWLLGRLRAQQHQSSGSEERKEHRWEVHRQQVILIQQQ